MGKLNVVDKPDGYRKIHKNPVPPAGGLVLISIWLFLLYLFPTSFSKKEIFFPILLFLTGFLDDIFDLAVIIKLTVQLVATFIISYKNNNPLYYTVITTLFYAIYINSVNFIDNSTGTAISFLILSFLFLYLLTVKPVFIYMVFTILGLLLLNLGLEKLFLGNSGSFFISALLVVSMDKILQFYFHGTCCAPIFLLYLVKNLFFLLLPLLDFIYVITRRLLERHPIFQADTRHLSFTLAKIFGPHYALLIWVLFLYLVLLFNIIFIKDNIPYIYSASE